MKRRMRRGPPSGIAALALLGFAPLISAAEPETKNVDPFEKINRPIYAFNDTFSTSSTFDPYKGYYFYNSESIRNSLEFPYTLLYATFDTLQLQQVYTWKVRIKLTANRIADNSVVLGVSPTARSQTDHFDLRKPRTVTVIPSVYFNRPEWDSNYSIFATDIRPEFDNIESWDFEVRGVHNQPSQLEFRGIEDIPDNFDVFLIDEGRCKTINLRQQANYDFIGMGEFSKFQVISPEKSGFVFSSVRNL